MAATEAYKQADAVGGAWRDTRKMIIQAQKLLKAGKEAEALKPSRGRNADLRGDQRVARRGPLAVLGHLRSNSTSA